MKNVRRFSCPLVYSSLVLCQKKATKDKATKDYPWADFLTTDEMTKDCL